MSYLGNGVGRQQVGAGQLGPAAVQYSNLDTSVTGPMSGYKNKIINGNFDIWQRATSGAGTGYCADRWYQAVAGSTCTGSRQAFTLGQTAVPYEPTYYYRAVVASVVNAPNYSIIQQRVESVRTFAGQQATLSFYAKADAAKNICVEFMQSFGTGGSPSADVVGIQSTTVPLTTNWQKYTVTVTFPSILGKTLGANGDDMIIALFWLEGGSNWNSRTNNLGQQSGTFEFSQVQFESGPNATQFEYRPRGIELALCQRYYYKTYDQGTVPGTATGNGAVQKLSVGANMFDCWAFPVAMRAAPSVLLYNASTGTTGTWRDATSNDRVVTATTSSQTLVAFNSTTVGSGAIITGHITANAEL